MTERFIPKKRIALDGKIWWCVWDNETNAWSNYLCHGKYKTKKDCIWCINKYNADVEWVKHFNKF